MNARSDSFKPREADAAQPAPVGQVPPVEAWDLLTKGLATLLDVRTVEERAFVGRVPGSIHVAWATGTAMVRNPHFARQVAAQLSKDAPLLLLCRSGKRSAEAAEALRKVGFTRVFNVLEGFEGERDAQGQRGRQDGWRFHGLPWEQD